MLVVFNYFLADMFINILSFVKALPLDFLIGNHTVRSETPIFFSKSTVSMFKRSIFIKQSCDKVELFKFLIKELLGLLKTFQRQNIAFNMWNIVKKKMLNCCPKSEKMLNFCSKARKVFKCAGNEKVPKKCPSQSGNTFFLAQISKILAGEDT